MGPPRTRRPWRWRRRTEPRRPPRRIPRTSRAESVALRTIVALKALKSAALFVVGLALFAVVGRDLGDLARRIAEAVNLDIHREYVWRAIERLSRLEVRHVSWSAGGAIVYACVLGIEAVGLARRRAWAAWLAVGVGSLLLPYEIYEMIVHPRLRLAAAIVVNVAVVVYLTIEALRANREYAKTAASAPAAAATAGAAGAK